MTVHWGNFLPEFILTAVAMGVLALDFLMRREQKHLLAWVSLAGVLVTIAAVLAKAGVEGQEFNGLFIFDRYATFFKVFLLGVGAYMLLASAEYVKKYLEHPGEYYGILLFSILGMMVMAASGELLSAYIALELFTFSLYILAGFNLRSIKSNEASIKYILVGAFSTALMLYGISLVYGALGTTTFEGMAQALAAGADMQVAFLTGLVLILVGLGFKVTAVPFHMWAPDVYEGAPTPVTAYLAIASKAASFALLLRLMAMGFGPALDEWKGVVAGLGVATIALGNLVAIAQTNIKRMLAYSSIGQAGYLLLGVAALSPLATSGIIFHLVAYAATNFAAFGVVIAYQNITGKEEISDYAGMHRTHPFMALVMSSALFSLAGLPIFAGFASKFYLFTGVAASGLLWTVGVAAVGSLVSLYYYLMVIKTMYLGDTESEHASLHAVEHTPALETAHAEAHAPAAAHHARHLPVVSGGSAEHAPLRLSPVMGFVLATLFLAIIVLGLYPQPLITLVEKAALSLPYPLG